MGFLSCPVNTINATIRDGSTRLKNITTISDTKRRMYEFIPL